MRDRYRFGRRVSAGLGIALAAVLAAQALTIQAAAAAAANGTGITIYGGTVGLDTTQDSSGYSLTDPNRGANPPISICDLADVPSNAAGVSCAPFTSTTSNTWGNGTMANPQSAAADALYGAQKTWDYFASVLGRNGIDGNGKGLTLRVHDGLFDNSNYDPGRNVANFGDGPGNVKQLVSLDIVAHEMTHAYTKYMVAGGIGFRVTNFPQTAALDESTSDIFGEMVKFAAGNGLEKGNYEPSLVVNYKDDGKPERYMYNPMLIGDGKSTGCYKAANFTNLNGHIGAGIGNHFFFNLAEGTASTAFGATQVCDTPQVTVVGIGRTLAARIWFNSLKYLSQTAGYADERVATLKAATNDLGSAGGLCSAPYRAVQAAWDSVQVSGTDQPCATYPASGQSGDLLLIHGFHGFSSNGSGGTVDGGCAGTWGDAETAFRLMGWSGSLHTVGYYAGDWQGGNSCDIQFDSHAPATAHVAACNSYHLSPADEGTNNQDLRNLSCQLAWYMFNTYTSHGRNVWIAAHSMGGLLARDALEQVNSHNPAYPPYLYVPGVVTFGTPHGGIPNPGGAGIICGGCVQASNMQHNAGEPSSFIDTLTAEAYAPTGSPGEPTQWTDISSEGEAWYNGISSDSAFTFPNARPGYPAVHKVLYQDVPGASPNPYDHGGYLEDSSGVPDARLLSCDNCGTPADSITTYHALALATVELSLPAPATPPYPVANQSGGGAFFDGWQSLTGVYGPLQQPTGTYQAVAGGQEQTFAGGGIYWSPPTGTHTVHGDIYVDYSGLGGPAGVLGFPTTDEQNAPGGGRESLFAGTNCGSASGSAILWTSATGAGQMQGCIYQAYLNAYGGPAGALGYPTSNEQAIASGRVNYLAGTTCSAGGTGSALYWNGVVHAVTGCIFQKYKQIGGAAGSYGFPVSEVYPITGGLRQDFQHGFLTDIGGTVTASSWVIGHAAHAGNDYPYETIGQFEHQDEGIDAWNEYYGQCDSFAAWKVYENLAGANAQRPTTVPAPGWTPGNAAISPVNQFTWGNADIWATKFAALGYTVDTVPAPGAIAYWPNAVTDPQDNNPPDPVNGMGTFGHVGYVTDVYADGSITIEQYNMRLNGEYSVVHLAHGQGYTDISFGQGSFSAPAPKYFIHVADGPSGAASPAEPANGVVQATYPSQVKVIGPGSSASEFATTDVWYNQPGHGELGGEMYTHTNGPTAVSTATWTPAGLPANTCYRIDVFVPDNYANNPIALYTVSDASGSANAAVNENGRTNDWSELGVFQTNGTGTGLSVKLDDRGATGLYVAADALRFWRQSDCSAQGVASPVLLPTSYSGAWTLRSGHGFAGNEHYSATSGTTSPTRTATWSPSNLIPGACYDVSLYVPDSYANNPAALYNTNDAVYGGNFWPSVNQNVSTNVFVGIGTFKPYSSGLLSVALQNIGPAGDFVAADAAAFVLNPHCAPANAGITFGTPMGSGIIGPGSSATSFATTGDWYTRLGHGFAAHELYTPDGSAATATWTFHGAANTCYSVAAYIPDNYADNLSALYNVSSSNGGGGAQVDMDTTTGWTDLASLHTGSNGVLTVTLNSNGASGRYTAADAIRFTTC